MEIKMVKIDNSSNIAEIGYDEPSQVLRVRFNTGLLYQYEKVPTVLHMQLMTAKSKGHYFSKHVRNNTNFPCKLVDEGSLKVDVTGSKEEVLAAFKSIAQPVYQQKNVGHGIVDTEALKKNEIQK